MCTPSEGKDEKKYIGVLETYIPKNEVEQTEFNVFFMRQAVALGRRLRCKLHKMASLYAKDDIKVTE